MQIAFHTVDAVYLRKESQMLTNALRNHSQSLLDGSAHMYIHTTPPTTERHHVETGPAFWTIMDVKK